MPYSKSHKQVARQRILDKASGLFISGGYDATTIKQIMAASNLTHGAFYGHFASKKDLFCQAVLKNSKNNQRSILCDEPQVSAQTKDSLLLRKNRDKQSLSFSSQLFRDDSVKTDPSLRSAYTHAFKSLCENMLDDNEANTKDSVFPMAAMIVGAETIAQNIDDLEMRNNLLGACKRQAELLAQGRYLAARNSYFWELN